MNLVTYTFFISFSLRVLADFSSDTTLTGSYSFTCAIDDYGMS